MRVIDINNFCTYCSLNYPEFATKRGKKILCNIVNLALEQSSTDGDKVINFIQSIIPGITVAEIAQFMPDHCISFETQKKKQFFKLLNVQEYVMADQIWKNADNHTDYGKKDRYIRGYSIELMKNGHPGWTRTHWIHNDPEVYFNTTTYKNNLLHQNCIPTGRICFRGYGIEKIDKIEIYSDDYVIGKMPTDDVSEDIQDDTLMEQPEEQVVVVE